MVKSTQWPENSQRALLEWLDARKGPESQLIRDNTNAIRQLKDSLGDRFTFNRPLSMAEINRRLKSLWDDKLPKFKSSKIDVFYREGSIALDWNKLSCRSIGKDYREDEIASYKQGNFPGTSTSADLSREADGDNDHDKPEDSFTSGNSEAQESRNEASGDEESGRQSKRRKVPQNSESRLESRGQRRSRHRRKSPLTGASKGQQPQVGRSDVNHNSRFVFLCHSEDSHAFFNPIANWLLKKMLTLLYIRPHRSAESDTATLTGAVNPASASAPAYHRESYDDTPWWTAPNPSVLEHPIRMERRDASEGEEPDGPSFEEPGPLELSDNPSSTPPKFIEMSMDYISKRINRVVHDFLDQSGISHAQPANLESDIRYPEQCRVLLGRVLGRIGYHGTDLRAEVLLAFHNTKTSLELFLQSFVACAVTFWCFECDVDEEKYFSALGAGDVKRTFDKAFTPVLLAEMRQRLWREHLDNSVKPKIESEAHRMASMLQTYIDFFVPTDKPQEGFLLDYHVVALPLNDPRKATEVSDGPAPRFKFDEPRERMRFRTSLADIIRDVLKWRTELSICLDEKYHFIWPRFLEPYDRNEHKIRWSRIPASDAEQSNQPQVSLGRIPASDAEQSNQPQVILGLRPVVWRMERTSVNNNEWTEWITLCKGHVFGVL